MAKIISSRKKYVPVKDLKVYPSNKETIEVIPDDCNGAHRYRAQMCAGFVNGKTKYVDAKGEPYMCTSDLTTWIGIDGDWYRVYVPSVVLGWPGILELAETEEELLDYLKDVSEFTRDEKGNN